MVLGYKEANTSPSQVKPGGWWVGATNQVEVHQARLDGVGISQKINIKN